MIPAVDVVSSIPLEHLHRYSYASELLRGKTVLDIAAREGYGPRILAETAAVVTALDPDTVVVQEAARKHKLPNLRFLVGSPLDIPIEQGHKFDAIVCFDAIEDSTNPDRLLPEIKRRLNPGGLLLFSVPRAASGENLFRTKPMTPEDLRRLLVSAFANVQVLNQELFAGSLIQLERPDSNGTAPSHGKPQYLLAIVSDSQLPALPASTYSDSAISLLRQKEEAVRGLLDTRAFQDETIKRQQGQLAQHKRTLASLEEAFAWHTSQIEALEKSKAYLENEIDQLRLAAASDRKALEWRQSQVKSLEATIASKDEGLAWRATQVEDLERSSRSSGEALADHQKNIDRLVHIERQLSQQAAHLSAELEAIHASAGWKFVLRARSIKAGLLRLMGK